LPAAQSTQIPLSPPPPDEPPPRRQAPSQAPLGRPKQRGQDAEGARTFAVTDAPQAPAALPPTPVPAPSPDSPVEAVIGINDVRRQWARVLEDIKRVKMICHALLIDGTPLDVAGDTLIVGLRSAYTFHMESLNRPENRDIVESALTKVLSTPLRFRCQLYDAPAPAHDEPEAHTNGETVSAGGPPVGGGAPSSLVDRAKELFGAQIVEEQ
jgi:hypothetical protein